MNISPISNLNFGWNIKTHLAVTEKAAENFGVLDKTEKRMLGRFSQMPDLIKEELQDMNSAHFYDVLSEDPSFGTINDDVNNAFSKFLTHTKKALEQTDRESFLRHIGFASHYLQDASTPPHTEHGNYLHKLYRIPMHTMFERGKKLGASSRLEELDAGFVEENLSFTNLETLFHNTALFSVQKENRVGYNNIKDWFGIQQRCFNRSINATRAYFEKMMKYLPEKKISEVAKKV